MKELVSEFNDEKTSEIELQNLGKISKEAFLKNNKPKSNIALIEEGDYTVAIDTDLNEDLIIEGMERELIRMIQVLRKDAGFRVEQRIELGIVSDGKLTKKILDKYIDKIKEEALVLKFYNEKMSDADISKDIEINDENITIYLKGM